MIRTFDIPVSEILLTINPEGYVKNITPRELLLAREGQ